MWQKLLVPHDFSACAARALGTAVELAKLHRAEVTLLHVSELPAGLPADLLVHPADAATPLRIDEYTSRAARKQLEAIAEPLRREGLTVHTMAVTGDVAERVFAFADEIHADALVVGTHGRKGLSHLFLGSVAEKLVRGASVPVVTVRTRAPEAGPTAEESDAQDELEG